MKRKSDKAARRREEKKQQRKAQRERGYKQALDGLRRWQERKKAANSGIAADGQEKYPMSIGYQNEESLSMENAKN